MVDVSPSGVLGVPWLRDTVVSTWILMALILVAAVVIRRRRPEIAEWLVRFLDGIVADSIGRPTGPYVPFMGALIVFLAVANALGMLPSTVTPTRDISTPAAMALVVLVMVNYFGIRAKGGLGYLKHVSSPVFMLPFEIIGQVSRTLSLTLRLFGNVISSELIVAVIYALIPLILPVPLIVLGMVTGLLQAYIFVVLAASYTSSAVRDPDAPRTDAPA
jgi:F-type H+-transporting ATPase subunit a